MADDIRLLRYLYVAAVGKDTPLLAKLSDALAEATREPEYADYRCGHENTTGACDTPARRDRKTCTTHRRFEKTAFDYSS